MAKTQQKRELLFKGQNLLSYKGSRYNYPEVGRFLARKLLTREEREAQCWFPRKTQPTNCDRTMVSSSVEEVFRGI